MNNLLRVFFAFAFIGFGASVAHSVTETEEFTTSTRADTYDLVWNIVTGTLHPTIQIYDWDEDAVIPYKSRSLSVGDGSHGVFDSSTYAAFSQGGDVSGNIIRLNTDTYPALKVTSFELENGWILQPVGGRPLIIQSLSTVVVSGIINCSGFAGSGLDSDNNQISAGGIGRCGGGDGGDGGSTPTAATDGIAGGASVTGGELGPLGGALGGQGGGGGGSYSQLVPASQADPGVNPAGGDGGGAGDNFLDDGFLEIGGGSGGGGGSVFDDLGDVPNHSSGAGGGGGGGVIFITAVDDVTVTATGEIHADGGDGGGILATGKGGGGGAGGGGSIAIFSSDEVIIDGAITAQRGSGGTTDGGDGGDGAIGRTWITDKDGIPGGGVVEDPVTLLALPGDVKYGESSFTATSKVIDTLNTKPQMALANITATTPGASTAELQIASGETSDFDPTGSWVIASSVVNTQLQRYIRFRVLLDSASRDNPAYVETVIIQYDKTRQEDFQFVGSCGLVKTPTPPPGTGAALLFLVLFPLGLAWAFRKKVVRV